MSDFTPPACGCCAGLDLETPARIDNPPGQPSIGYRVGTHASFKESLLARLSSPLMPALAGLTSRDDVDFSIALCDALATTLDVLTFHQERIANENLLRTASEPRSILELARLIGYQLAPGVAAATWLAFTLQEAPGAPALAAAPVEIPFGTRVQSVPGPGEQAQSFEIDEAVVARVEWNAIPVQTAIPWHPQRGDTELWLAGLGSGVVPGDVILIVGQERIDDSKSPRWDIRLLIEVAEDRLGQRTRLRWKAGLGSTTSPVEPSGLGATVHVFRQRASLFGHNAPDPNLIGSIRQSNTNALINKNPGKGKWLWKEFEIKPPMIDLDPANAKIIAGSWIGLVSNQPGAGSADLPGKVEVYKASSVRHITRSNFGISGKVTRITADHTQNLKASLFELRSTLVLAQSEPLAVAQTPLGYPLYGSDLVLGRLEPGITAGRALALRGKRARIRLRMGRSPETLEINTGESVPIAEGDSLRLIGEPQTKVGEDWTALLPPEFGAFLANPDTRQLRLSVMDRDGRKGTLTLEATAIEQVPADPSDAFVQEIAFVDKPLTTSPPDRDRSSFLLANRLQHCYDRETVTVNANVVHATHGETVTEILGSGDALVPNARFSLRQAPLTFVSASTASGRRSTLVFRANDLLWQEVATLYDRGSKERVYALAIDDQARTSLRFGDGIEGARLPSGDHNLRAVYRKGLGLPGNVAADSLTTLLSRPLGVAGATNPEPAAGGEDPETQDRARTNVPLTVRTLDRAVSVRDYQDFARAFAGIAKAHALFIPDGPARGLFLTVAGELGARVPETTCAKLLTALRRCGDPLVPLRLAGFTAVPFSIRLLVKADADSDAGLVLPAIEGALRSSFGFEARDFGQAVSVDEVAAIAQSVPGVKAVHIAALHRSDTPKPPLVPRIFAQLPIASLAGIPAAAELLTLDSAPLMLDLLP